MKKTRILLSLILVIVTVFMLAVPTFAQSLDEPINEIEIKSGEGTILRAEEIIYYYKYDSAGRLMYRIWSVTYSRWKTDWKYM